MPAGVHEQETLDVVPIGEASTQPPAPPARGRTQCDASATHAGTENMLLVVTGQITLEGQTNKLPFSHSFYLASDATGLYISNEMFRCGGAAALALCGGHRRVRYVPPCTRLHAQVCLYVAVQVIARSAAFRRTLVKL